VEARKADDAGHDQQGLSEADRRIVWEQFVDVYAHSQESFDSSIRTLAAGGVAVTVSIAAAFEELGTAGLVAVFLFLISLSFNLGSHATEQLDMRARLDCLRERRADRIEGNGWTTTTTVLNVLAGAALVAGGVLLATFAASAA
jgi:hypothetical protein